MPAEISQIRTLVAKNQIRQAINELKSFDKDSNYLLEITQLEAQLTDLEAKKRQRTISESQVETKKPQISMSQIDKDMEKKMKQKKEKDESDESQDEGPINYDFDLLDLSMDGGNNFKKKDKPNANDEPDFL